MKISETENNTKKNLEIIPTNPKLLASGYFVFYSMRIIAFVVCFSVASDILMTAK